VSMMIRADPDMKAVLEVSEERRENVNERLGELLRKEQEHADSRPSLLEFVRHKTGLRKRTSGEEGVGRDRGWPLPSLYTSGLPFAREKERYAQYDKLWLAGYVAYLYYRLHGRSLDLARAVWQLTRYIVTGAP